MSMLQRILNNSDKWIWLWNTRDDHRQNNAELFSAPVIGFG